MPCSRWGLSSLTRDGTPTPQRKCRALALPRFSWLRSTGTLAASQLTHYFLVSGSSASKQGPQSSCRTPNSRALGRSKLPGDAGSHAAPPTAVGAKAGFSPPPPISGKSRSSGKNRKGENTERRNSGREPRIDPDGPARIRNGKIESSVGFGDNS